MMDFYHNHKQQKCLCFEGLSKVKFDIFKFWVILLTEVFWGKKLQQEMKA